MKFNKGDIISTTEVNKGFEKGTVLGTVKIDGKLYYKLKIFCGTATIPIRAEKYYELYKDKKQKL